MTNKDTKALWQFAEKHKCLDGNCIGCIGDSNNGCVHPDHPLLSAEVKQDLCSVEEVMTYV